MDVVETTRNVKKVWNTKIVLEREKVKKIEN